MALTLKRAWLIIVLALGLLAGLVGWTVRMEAPATAHPTRIQTSHQLAWYCPPPPYSCF